MNDGAVSVPDVAASEALFNKVFADPKPRDEGGKFAPSQRPPEADEQQDTAEATETDLPVEQDAPEQSDEQNIEADDQEPETPIDPPSTWTEAEKARFRDLPRDVQEFIQSQENRRDRVTRQNSQKMVEAQRRFEQQAKEVEQQIQSLRIQAERYTADVVKQHQKQFADVTDPQTLAVTDPARFLQYQASHMKVMQSLQEQAMISQEEQKQRETSFRAFREKENETLRELIPAIKDDAGWQKFDTEISQFLINDGHDPEHIKAASAKQLKLAYDAMRWRNAEKARKAAEKSGKVVPQVQRPGVKSDRSTQEQRLAAARNSLKKTGSDKDANAFFLSIL